MKKQFLVLSFILSFVAIISSCKKSSDSSSSSPATGTSFTVSGKSYSANTQITVPNDSIVLSGQFSPSIPKSGGYISYTFSEQNGTSTDYLYVFGQANITSSGDTTTVLLAASLSPIGTGKYPIIALGATPTTIPFSEAAYNDTKATANFTDSLATGTLNITQINMTNKTISGNYSFTMTGTKNSTPSTIGITNGQLNSIKIQEF